MSQTRSPSSCSVLFVNQHYAPDLASTGQHLADLAEHLAGEGFDVHVLCARSAYVAGTVEAPKRERRNGVRVRRLFNTGFGRRSSLGRMVDYFTFLFSAGLWCLVRRRFSMVVTLTTPPLLPFLGFALRALKGQRYGVWSMDLHPEAEEALGMIPAGGAVSRLLTGVSRLGYTRADFVVDLGRHMKGRLTELGVKAERLHTISVWSRADELEPVAPEDNPIRDELGLSHRFVVMYSGNAGLAHRFDAILEAMEALRDDPEVFFLFVGGGPLKEEILAAVEEARLPNFSYLDYFPRQDLRDALSVGDVHLVSLRREMAGIAVPGKVYGIMAVGRPMLMVGPRACESAETITAAGCGQVFDPDELGRETGTTLAGAIRSLASDPSRRRELGARGRQAFLEAYEARISLERWRRLLEAECSSGLPAP